MYRIINKNAIIYHQVPVKALALLYLQHLLVLVNLLILPKLQKVCSFKFCHNLLFYFLGQIGVIVGGVVGGFALVLVITILIVVLVLYKKWTRAVPGFSGKL